MYGAGRREREGGREEEGERQAGEIKLSNANFLVTLCCGVRIFFTVPEVELHQWRHSAGPRVTEEYEIGPLVRYFAAWCHRHFMEHAHLECETPLLFLTRMYIVCWIPELLIVSLGCCCLFLHHL